MTVSSIDSPQPISKFAKPDFSIETDFLASGAQFICGVDEAGRGPLAGPVTAAAVILDPDNVPEGLQDSKKLTEKRREDLYDLILQNATVSIAHVSAKTIDRINIRAASLLAMTRAVRALETGASHALIDGNALPDNLPCPATALVKGDARSVSIAAASIIAKVTRDRLMVRADSLFPGFGLAGHKGYPTKSHMQAVMDQGPSPLHRMTFAPVRAALRKR